MKYLDFYKKYTDVGILPKMGLCSCFPNDNILSLFSNGSNLTGYGFWGNGGEYTKGKTSDYHWQRDFTPLRQNIVLLMAAMAGEL
jgi:hypothetical protein